MKAHLSGESPLARNADGTLKYPLGAVFPDDGAVVAGRGIHATLKLQYLERLRAQGRALSPAEEKHVLERSVDLVMREDSVFIRPERDQLELAFAADELLQQIVPKYRIRFLGALDEAVRRALQRRGECWRFNPMPRTEEDMKRMIRAAKSSIAARPMYYHDMETGTKFLTCDEFAQLEALPADKLAACLDEIREYSARRTKRDHPEVAFFKARDPFGPAAFGDRAFSGLAEAGLRAAYAELRQRFTAATPAEYRADDEADPTWRIAMFASLMGSLDHALAEEVLLGLSAEFQLRVRWLPGARLEDGELVYDAVYDDPPPTPPGAEPLCDEKVRSMIFNLLPEHDYQVEYINIARVPESLSKREAGKTSGGVPGPLGPRSPTAVVPKSLARRGVYLAEIKETGRPSETVKLLRLQKWDVRERLMEGKGLLQAVLESQEYTEYVLDRQLACKQLGMALLPVRRETVTEHWHGQLLRLTYFERDYVYGLATDKIPPSRYAQPEFGATLARLMGEAAAPNIVVGRVGLEGKVLFDDGDEVLVEDEQKGERSIIVADASGSFADFRNPLEHFAPAYAGVVTRRAGQVQDLRGFADIYLQALVERLGKLQQLYRQRQRAFDTLFHHRRREPGALADRWEKVLARLVSTQPAQLGAAIRACLKGKL